MGALTLVTGGARSGKSTYAEKLAAGLGKNIVYIATSVACDQEMKLRIEKHRKQRPGHWTTLEAYSELDVRLDRLEPGYEGILLDCVTVMVSNIMMDVIDDWENMDLDHIRKAEDCAKDQISRLIKKIRELDIPAILVTNEVGMGVVPEYPSARAFRDIAGRMNQIIAAGCDHVYICVSGIPLKIK